MAIENDDLLYVYDTDAGEGKKIKYETLKSGTGGTGEFGYWNRTGTTLSPTNAGDFVRVTNGTTLTDVFAEGQVWTTHNLSSTDLVFATRKGSADQNFAVYGDGGIGIGSDVTTKSTNNISLNADGRIDTAQGVKITGDYGLNTFSDKSGYIISVNNAGGTSPKFGVDNGGTVKISDTDINTAPKIILNEDGSATFAGTIKTGNPSGGLNAGAALTPIVTGKHQTLEKFHLRY